MKSTVTYLAIFVCIVALDLLWLRVIAVQWYADNMGALLTNSPNLFGEKGEKEVVAGLAVQTTDPASRRGTSYTKLRSHWNRRPWWSARDRIRAPTYTL